MIATSMSTEQSSEHTSKGRGDLLDRSKAAETLKLVADSDGHFGLVVVVWVEVGERCPQPLRVFLQGGVSVL